MRKCPSIGKEDGNITIKPRIYVLFVLKENRCKIIKNKTLVIMFFAFSFP